jgi:hypothetical protein
MQCNVPKLTLQAMSQSPGDGLKCWYCQKIKGLKKKKTLQSNVKSFRKNEN